MNGQWEKIGKFNQMQNLGWDVPLNRQVTFKNSRPDNHIKEFLLGGYRNGSFQVVMKARNRQSYEQLKQAVVQAGIEEPDFSDNDTKVFRLITVHLGLIGKFLNSLESVEPSFTSVKQDVCTTLAIDPNQDYSIPIWLIEGNFNQTQHFGPGAILNRTLTFKNTRLSHCIKELELLGYRDGTFRVMATARNDQNFQQLSQAIIEAGLQAPDSTDRMLKHVTLKNITLVTYSQPLDNFINAIQTVLPEIELIKQDILNAFQNLAAHSVPHLPTHSFAPLIAANPLLFIHAEENKLDELTVEPVVEPSTAEPTVIIHAFKKRVRTTELERLREEANNFTGGELPAKRKRTPRITPH